MAEIVSPATIETAATTTALLFRNAMLAQLEVGVAIVDPVTDRAANLDRERA